MNQPDTTIDSEKDEELEENEYNVCARSHNK